MTHCFGIGEIIDGNKFNIFIPVTGAKDKSADSSETVDGYSDGHSFLLLPDCFLGTDFIGSVVILVASNMV